MSCNLQVNFVTEIEIQWPFSGKKLFGKNAVILLYATLYDKTLNLILLNQLLQYYDISNTVNNQGHYSVHAYHSLLSNTQMHILPICIGTHTCTLHYTMPQYNYIINTNVPSEKIVKPFLM